MPYPSEDPPRSCECPDKRLFSGLRRSNLPVPKEGGIHSILSRDPVHAAGLCKGLWCTLDPGSSPGMTKVPGMFQFHRARSTGDQVVPCLQVGLGFVLTGWGRDLCWPGGAGVGADEAVSAKADLDTPHGHYPTNARIAACAILSASTAKKRRSAARVSLRPKPSVPSVV